jgi:hypothetical protein
MIFISRKSRDPNAIHTDSTAQTKTGALTLSSTLAVGGTLTVTSFTTLNQSLNVVYTSNASPNGHAINTSNGGIQTPVAFESNIGWLKFTRMQHTLTNPQTLTTGSNVNPEPSSTTGGFIIVTAASPVTSIRISYPTLLGSGSVIKVFNIGSNNITFAAQTGVPSLNLKLEASTLVLPPNSVVEFIYIDYTTVPGYSGYEEGWRQISKVVTSN